MGRLFFWFECFERFECLDKNCVGSSGGLGVCLHICLWVILVHITCLAAARGNLLIACRLLGETLIGLPAGSSGSLILELSKTFLYHSLGCFCSLGGHCKLDCLSA